MHVLRRTALVCSLVLAQLSCGTTRRIAVEPGPESACAIVPTGATPPDSISVATTGGVDASHAPVPSNEAERFVFAQLYETLINVDCEGRAYPGLAKSWTLDASRTRVTLALRDSGRFWSGKPVVAADVVAAWRATGGQSTDASTLARRMADVTTIVDEHTLTVSLPDTAWRILAAPALAVFEPTAGSAWPEGTAAYRVAESAPVLERSRVVLASDPLSGGPTIVIRSTTTNDARDAVDRGADLLVTNDPLALAYAASRPGLAAVPLPWSRTYALAMPGSALVDSALLRRAVGDSASAFRAALARDAVRVEARAAESPYWWSDIQNCESAGPRVTSSPSPAPRQLGLAYDARDRVARQLAERLVALGGRAIAVPLAPDAFARALRDGSEAGYVIGLPRVSLDACRDAARFAATAPWLLPPSNEARAAAAPKIIPLVDTRQRAIVNHDHVSATIDWDGTLRFGSAPKAP